MYWVFFFVRAATLKQSTSTLSFTLSFVVDKCHTNNAQTKTHGSNFLQKTPHRCLPCCPLHSRKTCICEMVKWCFTDSAAASCINAATNLLMALGIAKAYTKPA
jgi:hypothetical protein